MWDSIKTAVRNATCIFEKASGSHKECPRCRGSGLLLSSRRLRLAVSNEPCWFCEGVGALPIVGLKGFVLARAMASLQNCKQSPQLGPPLMLGLHSSKYPETKCNVKTFKTHKEVADLEHDFSSAPSWLGPSVKRVASKDEAYKVQGIHPTRKKIGSSKSSSSSQTLQSSSKIFGLIQVPNRKNIQVLPSTPSTSANNHLQTITMCSMATDEQRSGEGFQKTDGFQTGPFGSNSNPEIHFESLVNRANIQTRHVPQPYISKMRTDVLNSAVISFPIAVGLQLKPSITVSRSHQRPRKKRNRIREKAQKEALERARKIVGTLKFKKDELSPAEQYEHSDVNPFMKKHPSDVRSILHEPPTAGGQSLLFAAASKDGLGGNFSSFGQSWLDVLISSGTQDLMRLPSARRQPSKSQLER